MKFAKELESELVPEWKVKYLNYKIGKKKLKAVARAIRNANRTPQTPQRTETDPVNGSHYDPISSYTFSRTWTGRRKAQDGQPEDPQSAPPTLAARAASVDNTGERGPSSPVKLIPRHGGAETQPLTGSDGLRREYRESGMTRYGSIIGSPPASNQRAPELELPDPAIDPNEASSIMNPRTSESLRHVKTDNSRSSPGNAFEIGKICQSPSKLNPFKSKRNQHLTGPRRVNSTPGISGSGRPLTKRMMSVGTLGSGRAPKPADIPLDVYREVEFRQAEFFLFLDKELEKIGSFYKEKEDEATHRLDVLREQLHTMRDKRMEEIITTRQDRINRRGYGHSASGEDFVNGNALNGASKPNGDSNLASNRWIGGLVSRWESVKSGRVGKNSKAMENLGTPESLQPQNNRLDSARDYTRRPATTDIPYRAAKRKLKIAMAEYYRGLELLKSYSLLNQKAFRKICKKYDKTVNARPPGRYTQEKVNNAYFVQSDVLDGHIRTVEDLYARYFERGNHKVAVGKLRAKSSKSEDFNASSFRNGLWVAAGLVFGIQGLVYAAQLLKSPDPVLAVNTSYLLQLYAGYSLLLLLMILFLLDCRVWSISKINYAFVFEFDTRHHFDWRQLFEIPCFFLFLLGFFMWINFTRYGTNAMYLYYPVILIGVSLITLCLPAPILYYQSRRWFLYSHWRLLLAGLYPVEFRDFFLGDMYCSETYAMGYIEVFFCLYARYWRDPPQCNSSNSRLLGFFSTLPGIWRALQCIRRYKDTRNFFPHLVNCGKYTFTILYYMTLSLYRIHKTTEMKALFIVFAAINAIYCSIWDLIMDWSLGDPYAHYPFLRDVLGYKQIWMYYVAMVLDPILRFNWIFYAIYTEDVQHSAILSFFVALSEVLRRGMWTLFRVENEHCTNVGRFRASRDVALPYDIPSSDTASKQSLTAAENTPASSPHLPSMGIRPSRHAESVKDSTPTHRAEHPPAPQGADLEAARTHETSATTATEHTDASGVRNRGPRRGNTFFGNSPVAAGLSRVGTLLHSAHAQDFERKKKVPGQDEAVDDEDEDEERGTSDEESDRDVDIAMGRRHEDAKMSHRGAEEDASGSRG
ncbi:MAG: hypothetical protein M1820_004671 [Bogoriella megaspora]|nr:MAG: hypothetical protein M1820_004671 [Bogoriella megaspora]